MPCAYHGNFCAYPDWSPDRCEICHAPWSKIMAPATRKVGRETRYLDGYGETPLNHLWRHAVDLLRAEAGAARKARVAAKRRAA